MQNGKPYSRSTGLNHAEGAQEAPPDPEGETREELSDPKENTQEAS